MKHLLPIFTCLAVVVTLVASAGAVDTAAGPAAPGQIYVIPVSGTVDPGMATYVQRALDSVPADPAVVVVLEMDTFGGRVDAALDIVQTLLDAGPRKTVAYVSVKAISAGALIALACNELIMKQHTTIGDCAPITYANDGPKMMGEKFQSPLRAKFRTLARRNGYPEKLAEAMVTADMEVFAVTVDGHTRYLDAEAFADLPEAEKSRVQQKRTVVSEGELLTMDDTEAYDLGFSRASVADMDALAAMLGAGGRPPTRIEESWSETLVRFIGSIAPILMMIGLAALYTEIKAPGFGVPGIVGIACLALVFLNQYLVGLADHTELILLVAGLILLGFELFVIPGFGIAGIAGLVCICAGMILALQDFVVPDPALPWQKALLVRNTARVGAALLCAFVASLAVLRYVLPGVSRVVQGPYLDATLREARSAADRPPAVRTGETGTAVTFLHPAGKVKIDGQTYDAISEGEFIEKNSRVTVAAVRGDRIIVGKTPENGT